MASQSDRIYSGYCTAGVDMDFWYKLLLEGFSIPGCKNADTKVTDPKFVLK